MKPKIPQKEHIENQYLDDVEIAIRNFILDNLGCTINKVAVEMVQQDVCAIDTAKKKINRMIIRQILEDRKQGNSFHSLYVINKNEFTKIYAKLSRIEDSMNAIEEVRQKIMRRRFELSAFEVASTDMPELGVLSSVELQFLFPFYEVYSQVLLFLLNKAGTSVRSKDDFHILYEKILTLLLELSDRFYTIKFLTSLDSFADRLKTTREEISRGTNPRAKTMKKILSIGMLDHIAATIDDIKKTILI